MTHHRNAHSTRRAGQAGHPSGQAVSPVSEPDPESDPEAAARAAMAAGEAALRAGQTLNAGRWLRLSRTLLALARDLEAQARKTEAPAQPLYAHGFSPEDIAEENDIEADIMAIVLAREAGLPEPAARYEGSLEHADFYMRLRAAQRAGLWDEIAFQRGELDLDDLDLDAWLPPAWHSS
jgi:hypothetical protein